VYVQALADDHAEVLCHNNSINPILSVVRSHGKECEPTLIPCWPVLYPEIEPHS
jgi:hypothetical protein